MGDIEEKPSWDGSAAAEIEKVGTKETLDSFVPPTPEEEAAVIKKLDWRLLPLVFVLYSLAVLDRSSMPPPPSTNPIIQQLTSPLPQKT